MKRDKTLTLTFCCAVTIWLFLTSCCARDMLGLAALTGGGSTGGWVMSIRSTGPISPVAKGCRIWGRYLFWRRSCIAFRSGLMTLLLKEKVESVHTENKEIPCIYITMVLEVFYPTAWSQTKLSHCYSAMSGCWRKQPIGLCNLHNLAGLVLCWYLPMPLLISPINSP